MIVNTTDEYGNPQCPIDLTPVKREGEFCTPECWQSFHRIIHDTAEVIEMNYLDLYEQPWYGRHHG